MTADEAFDAWFWPAYPNKIAKVPARDAFRWAWAHFGGEALRGPILDAILWQRALASADHMMLRPDKWLLQQRWTDERPRPRQRPVVATAAERAAYIAWSRAVGTAGIAMPLDQFVQRQRKGVQ